MYIKITTILEICYRTAQEKHHLFIQKICERVVMSRINSLQQPAFEEALLYKRL